jgi:hypothetical protein
LTLVAGAPLPLLDPELQAMAVTRPRHAVANAVLIAPPFTKERVTQKDQKIRKVRPYPS